MEVTDINLTNAAFLAINVTTLILFFLAYRKLAVFYDMWLDWKKGWINKEYKAPRWDYKFIIDWDDTLPSYREQEWQLLGDQGWELVSTHVRPEIGGTLSTFKRRSGIFEWQPSRIEVRPYPPR